MSSDCGYVDYVQWSPTGTTVAALTEAVDSDLTFTTGGGANWSSQTTTYFYGGDAAKSGAIGDYGQSWMRTTVQGEGVITFYWKVSSENGCDFVEFLVDGVRKASLSGNSDWQKKAFTITGTGTHILHWEYRKNDSGSSGSDCAWVDCVQWPAALTQWDTVSYVYDPGGRRIEKKYDGQAVMKYFYDGDHIIAEYDATGALMHKYIYGPGVDQPLCMIDVSDANATYYYHFDGLGSVIALTDSDANVVQLYEYSIYGQVAASDPNHPNRFLFTGREFDAETGLYYYRARYYNPYIGRFLQTDPAGEGMNSYAYCGNDPTGLTDPSGLREFDPITPHLVCPDMAYVAFEFKFPALAIGLDITSDESAFVVAYRFFSADWWTGWPADWLVQGAHLEDDGMTAHVRFIDWYNPILYPAPTAPALSWARVNENHPVAHVNSTEPVVLLNNVGLLTRWKFDRIVDLAKHKVEWWRVRPFGPHLIPTRYETRRLQNADTPFHDSPIDKWQFGHVIYDNSQINYYLEGWAMRHFSYHRFLAEQLVLQWKARLAKQRGCIPPTRDDLWAEFFWFDMGWHEHGVSEPWMPE